MEADAALEIIESEGRSLLGYASRDLSRSVPQYPTWTMRDLLLHVAAIHARTIQVCRLLPRERLPAPEPPTGTDPLGWYQSNLAEMLQALAAADPEAEMWTFTPPNRVGSWARRMLIETSLHRWDAQQAFEAPDALPVEVSVAGLDEFADMWLPRLPDLATIELRPTDHGGVWRYGDGEPQHVVTGPVSAMFLRLMARPGIDLPSEWEAAVDGLRGPAG